MDAQGEFEFYIGDKRVQLKQRIPLKVAPKLPVLLEQVEKDLRAVARVGVLMIEEWDFEGSPADLRAYEDLDIFSELMPLASRLGEHINRRMEYAGAKN